MVDKCTLIDVGNSTLKAVTIEVNAQERSVNLVSPLQVYSDIEKWFLAENVNGDQHKVWFASVRNDDENRQIGEYLSQQGLAYKQIYTSTEAFGVKNSYANTDKLGVDRWLAMLAGDLLSNGNCLVADAGTALTVDALIAHQHVGGWISPGLQLAKDAVTGNTRRVFQTTDVYQKLSFGCDTEECLALGCAAQLHGTLMTAVQVMQQQQPDFEVIISGGDVELIKSISQSLPIRHSVMYKPNIVLLGLLRFVLADFPLKSARKTAQSLVI